MRIKSITIREDQNEWLQQHKDLNLSGLTQKMLDEKMRQHE